MSASPPHSPQCREICSVTLEFAGNGRNVAILAREPDSADDSSQKRPSQGGTKAEQDREKQDQGGQRRAS
jgi:hypothetical protein